jgi:RNA polymerase sigma factor (TIGR02999 family)
MQKPMKPATNLFATLPPYEPREMQRLGPISISPTKVAPRFICIGAIWVEKLAGCADFSLRKSGELCVRRVIISGTYGEVSEYKKLMSGEESNEVTRLLRAWGQGDEDALQRLVPLVYEQLHAAARRYMVGERLGHTLQATALIHETYLRLVNVKQIKWQNRAHFFAICAQLMRRILVDFARSRGYQKRGGGAQRVDLDEILVVSSEPEATLVALDEALRRLADIDRRKSQVVELRFFGGLDVKETAEVMKVSPDTVMRDWKMAKVWLLRELDGEARHRT